MNLLKKKMLRLCIKVYNIVLKIKCCPYIIINKIFVFGQYFYFWEGINLAEERKKDTRHRMILEDRERMSITGVIDVLSFDEESIIAETEKGMLILRGNNMHVGKLNLDEGEVSVDGLIDTIEYSEGGISKGKNSFLNRIFK